MKKIFIVTSFVCFSILVNGQRNVDVLHYKYHIELSDNNDTIYGNAAIQLKIISGTRTIKLDLVKKNEAGKGMIIDSISGPGIKGFVKDRDSVRIMLFPNTKPVLYDTVTYAIKYHGVPADGLIISKNKYGNRTFFSDNWPNRAHNWIPCVDDPADKASVEFIITAPSHYQIISNGVQIEETNLPGNKKLTHYKEVVPLPTKVMVIGAADFAVQQVGEINCIPIYSWVFPENKTEGFYDYAEAKDILSFFINYIGPYPYKKLANVQSKTRFGGMENAGAIFYFENSVTGDRQQETLVAHEIVHQWFGNMATEKSFAHIWLSEGFATYLTHIYVENKYGSDSLNKRMQSERAEIIDFVKTSRKPVVDSISSYMQLLNTNSYQKGGWVLHMLRRQLGDSVFKKSIRKYYEMYAGKNADTRDLQKVFESVSGKNFEQFFTQWLYTNENPKLKITWKNVPNEKKVAVTIEQLQNNIFEFPLDLLLITGSRKKTDTKINITKKVEKFYLLTNSPLLSLDVDFNTSILAEISVSEAK
jgi:aminopeptidase N